MTLQVHHAVCDAINDFGNLKQKKKYLPPLAKGETLGVLAVTDPTGGSDLVGIKTSAELNGNKYILNGRKCFITNAPISDFWIVIARTAEGAKGLSAFIVERDAFGAKLGRQENKFGLRGSTSGELVFEDCEVPKECLLGQEGAGLAIAIKTISETLRIGIAATALGLLTAAYEEAGKFASERVLYTKPVSTLQAIQFYMADIYSQLEICRLLCYRASWLKDQKIRCDIEAALAKYYTCEAAVTAAKKAIEIHGAYGIMKESKVQQLLRDAIVTIPAGGTAEIAKVILARAALAPFKK